MTRSAVRATYRQLLDQLTEEMLHVIKEEFGGGIFGKAASMGARSVTKRIQREMRTQGDIVVDYAAAIAAGTNDKARLEREFLETNPVHQRYNGSDTGELEEHLLDHFRTVGNDLAPLVSSDVDDFWEALEAEYSRQEAEQILDRHFNQAATFKRYRRDLFASQTLGKRVIGVLEKAENRMKSYLHQELDRTYGN